MQIIDYARRLAAPARWIIILGIVATVAYRVYSIVYMPNNVAVAATGQLNPAPIKNTTRPTNIDAVVNLHLFGKPSTRAATRPASVTNAQATRLPLELKAVFAATDNTFSAAIIGQRGQAARLYSVGESVPGNAVLAEVYADQVLLRRAGQLESLAFPKTTFTAKSSGSIPSAGNATAPGQPVDQTKSASSSASTAEAQQLAQQLAANPQQAAKQLGLSARAEGGYRISNVANSPYFQRAGLRSGDVILSINGKPLNDAQPSQAMMDELMASGTARVVLLRNNDRLTITATVPKLR